MSAHSFRRIALLDQKKKRPPGRNWDPAPAPAPQREESFGEKLVRAGKKAIQDGLFRGGDKVEGTDETRRKFKFD
jgi:hypothetical protein